MNDCKDGCTYGFDYDFMNELSPVNKKVFSPVYEFVFCPWCGRKLEEEVKEEL